MKTISLSKLCLLLVMVTGLLFAVSCKKDAPVAPPIPPGGGGGTVVIPIPDTTIPAPGPKVKWVLNAGSETAANGTFKIVNKLTGKMLNVSTNADGLQMIQMAENGSANQKWTLLLNANSSFTVTNMFSSKVLKAKNCSGANDSLVQNTSSGSACEQWQFVSTGNGYYRITNQSSGNSLAVSNSSLEDSAAIIINSYLGADAQQWQLRVIPDAVTQNAYNLITAAMNLAVKRYNKWGNFDKLVTVNYVPSVPTADANYSGNMRFGANTQYMVEGTALHELGHCMGVGTSPRWTAPLVVGANFVGAKTLQWVKYYDGANAVINCDTQHFWPYGLNFAGEYSQTAFDRHVRIIWAMRQDGL
jgi:Ricin-type beta-trefoil lectin domain-like